MQLQLYQNKQCQNPVRNPFLHMRSNLEGGGKASAHSTQTSQKLPCLLLPFGLCKKIKLKLTDDTVSPYEMSFIISINCKDQP